MNAQDLLKEMHELDIPVDLIDGESDLLDDECWHRPTSRDGKSALHNNIDLFARILSNPDKSEPIDPLSELIVKQTLRRVATGQLFYWMDNDDDIPEPRHFYYQWCYAVDEVSVCEFIINALKDNGYAPVTGATGVLGRVVILKLDENVRVPERWQDCVSYTPPEMQSILGFDRATLTFMEGTDCFTGFLAE